MGRVAVVGRLVLRIRGGICATAARLVVRHARLRPAPHPLAARDSPRGVSWPARSRRCLGEIAHSRIDDDLAVFKPPTSGYDRRIPHRLILCVADDVVGFFGSSLPGDCCVICSRRETCSQVSCKWVCSTRFSSGSVAAAIIFGSAATICFSAESRCSIWSTCNLRRLSILGGVKPHNILQTMGG